MNLPMLMSALLTTSIFLSVLALGLRTSRQDLRYLLSQRSLLARSLLSMNVLAPLAVAFFLYAFALHPALKVALMALALAGAGLYGVVSYLTAQRRREFGIRVAVGAQATDVLTLVLKQGLGRSALGLTLGLALSAALTRALGAMLYGVSAWDTATYVSVSGLLMFVVLAATLIPAWRASRLDPTLALRAE